MEEEVRRCVWIEWQAGEGSYWDTLCGEAISWDQGDPESHGFRFCPYCGKELIPLFVPKEPLWT